MATVDVVDGPNEGTALLTEQAERTASINSLRQTVKVREEQFDHLQIGGAEREELSELHHTLDELKDEHSSLSPNDATENKLTTSSDSLNGSVAVADKGYTNSTMARESAAKDQSLLKKYWPSSKKKAYASERALLNLALTSQGVEWEIFRPEVSTKVEGRMCKRTRDVRVNYIKIGNGPTNVVFLHGYGCSAGFWFPVLRYLAKKYPNDYTLYSLDLLGFGLSSRVEFPKSKDAEELAEMAEQFFSDELENWRIHVGLEGFQLAGHSLGGYIAGIYTLQYPDRVEKLHLISPAALPKRPEDALKNLRSHGVLVKVVLAGYNSNVTPFSIVRSLGHLGPKFIKGYAGRRFTTLDPEEAKALTKYMYHTAALPGSGEYALKAVFLPGDGGVYGVIPLGQRLVQLSETNTPVSFFYGADDWMNVNDAREIAPLMQPRPNIHVVEAAGHNIHIDNPIEFNRRFATELRGVTLKT